MSQEQYIKYYWSIFLRRKHYFIWPALAIVLFTTVLALFLPPIYQSSATILIEDQQIPPDFVRSTVTGFAEQRIQILNQQILSRTGLLEIIKQFNLYPDLRNKNTQEEIVEKMRNDIKVEIISAQLGDQRKRGRQGKGDGMAIAFTIAYRGRNPEMVQRVTSALTSYYLQENLKIREQQAKSTTQFLENELKEIQEHIKKLGDKITEFKSKNEGIMPELYQYNMSQAERLEREIEQLNIQIRSAEERKIYLEGQLATVKTDIAIVGDKVTDPHSRLKALQILLIDLQSRYSETHPDIQKVKREITELKKITENNNDGNSLKKNKLFQLKVELAQKQGQYSEQHPEIIKIKKEIAEMERTLISSRPNESLSQPDNPAYINLLANIHAANLDIKALKQQKAELEDKLKSYRQRLELAPQVEQEYLALTRDYQNAHAKHQEIMNKILEARIAEGLEEAQKAERFTIIDPASYPEKPISPKRELIILVGLIIGLFGSLGIVILAENLDDSVKNTDELAMISGLPVLGSITRIITKEEMERRKKWRRIVCLIVIVSFPIIFIMIHLYYKDIWFIITKLNRLIAKYL